MVEPEHEWGSNTTLNHQSLWFSPSHPSIHPSTHPPATMVPFPFQNNLTAMPKTIVAILQIEDLSLGYEYAILTPPSPLSSLGVDFGQ